MNNEKALNDGLCEFCGQVVQFDNEILHKTKGDRRTAAKLFCDCTEAKIFQRRYKNTSEGIAKVDEIAGKDSNKPVSNEVISYLHQAVIRIVNHDIQKATVQISNVEKVTVAATKKGIKVSREIKKTDDSEVEMLL